MPIYGYLYDKPSIRNTFTVDNCSTQTTKADFAGGIQSNVYINTIPGDIILVLSGNHYMTTGIQTSNVYDTGKPGTSIDMIQWNSIVPAKTNITFSIRASDTPFTTNSTLVVWTPIGKTSPIYTGLLKGRYAQWQAILTTLDNTVTPDLQNVDTWYH